jgi:hypothetical protein
MWFTTINNNDGVGPNLMINILLYFGCILVSQDPRKTCARSSHSNHSIVFYEGHCSIEYEIINQIFGLLLIAINILSTPISHSHGIISQK